MTSPADVVFLSGARTGFGAFGGALKSLSATDLGVVAGKAAAIERSGLGAELIDHVVIGNAQQTSADAIYLARHIGLRSGCRVETPALTVNRLCGSGFEAVVQAAQQIRLGESRVVLAGGTESMSQAPHVVRGRALGAQVRAGSRRWRTRSGRHCATAGATRRWRRRRRTWRPSTASTARPWMPMRSMSQQRARDAWAAGAFTDELAPVALTDPKTKQPVAWARDEHMRPTPRLEGLAKLTPVFRKGGVVTAGNASGIADGAAAMVVADATLRPGAGTETAGPAGRVCGGGCRAFPHGHRSGTGRPRGARASEA